MDKKLNLTLRLSQEQSEMAAKMAEQDHRSQQGEFLWLLEAYASGELIRSARVHKALNDIESEMMRMKKSMALQDMELDKLAQQIQSDMRDLLNELKEVRVSKRADLEVVRDRPQNDLRRRKRDRGL